MTDDTSQLAVVITTSSPGFAWICLRAAGLEPKRTAVLTTPGASLPDGDDSLGRTLAAAAGMANAQQIAIIGHASDPAYRIGVEGLSGRARRWGVDPRRGGWGSEIPFPRLAKTAERTVARAVQTLAQAPWLPPQISILGIVVTDTGSVDTVALQVTSGPGGAPAATREEPERRPEPEPLPLDAAAPVDPLGGSGTGGAISSGPAAIGGALTSGPAVLGEAVTSGPATLGGPLASGPATLGGALSSGPAALGGPLTTGEQSLDDGAAAGQSTGPVISGEAAAFDPLPPSALEALTTTPVEEGTESKGDLFEELDLMDGWMKEGAATRPAPKRPRRSRGRKQGGGEELDQRIRQATGILARFVTEHCQHHPLRRDMKHLLRTGASPETVMRNLYALVKDLGGDMPEVRAAFGTLEMAQAMVDRATHQALLRTIIL